MQLYSNSTNVYFCAILLQLLVTNWKKLFCIFAPNSCCKYISNFVKINMQIFICKCDVGKEKMYKKWIKLYYLQTKQVFCHVNPLACSDWMSREHVLKARWWPSHALLEKKKCHCGHIRLILRQRIDDLSYFRCTAGTECGQWEESLADRGELQ